MNEIVSTLLLDIPANPYGEDYDPAANVSTIDIAKEMCKKMKAIHFQSKLPEFKAIVAKIEGKPDAKFYLLDFSDAKKVFLKNLIQKLGGTVTKSLEETTCIVFYPTKEQMNLQSIFTLITGALLGGTVTKSLEETTCIIFYPTKEQMNLQSIFTFITGALVGRYLLPVSYILESYDIKEFLNMDDFCTMDYIESKYILHKTTIAAIKMSIFNRNKYKRNAIPAFHHQRILFAIPEGQDDDVKLILKCLGAYVHPYHVDNECSHGQLFTLCITDGQINLPCFAQSIPTKTPYDIRTILWDHLK
uniref:BRCT domain-containing protein n=1 Tax=Panagrolaimus sp. PS1159 TaxID=55785 RepID=A0AC35GWC9_9BILA